RHVVEFASSIEVGAFHHVSSIAVAGRYKGLFREDMFDEGQKLPHAYHRTKFESEKVVREGIKAPLRVYRPGIVVGHSQTGEMDNECAKAAHAPRFAMRVDAHLTDVIPKPVAAGLNAIPTVAKIRETVLRDLHIPPAALENRDFDADFDMRDTQRALRGTGIAVPPLSTYATKLWAYWERNLDPDLFRQRSATQSVHAKRILVTAAP